MTDAQARLDTNQAQLAEAQSELNARARRAVAGLGLATSLAATIHMLALFFLLRRRLNGLHSRRLLISIGKTLAATAALCGVTWVLKAFVETFLPEHIAPKLGAAIVLSVTLTLGAGTFLVAARLLRMGEIQSAIDLIRRRRRG